MRSRPTPSLPGFFRGPKLWGVLAAGLVYCCYAGRLAAAEAVPLDPAGFTDYVVAKFHKMIPDDTIEVISPLRLRVRSPRGGWSATLEHVHDVCRRSRAACADNVEDYIRGMSANYESPSPPPDRSLLRVVVRASQDADAACDCVLSSKPLAVPLQGDLWMVGRRRSICRWNAI